MSLDKTVRRHLSNCYGLDPGDVERVFVAYAGVLRRAAACLETAVEEGQREEASAQAHALKGALLNLGLDEPAQSASALEQEFKRGINRDNVDRARQLMKKLSPMMHNFPGKEEDR
jgi:hypothetical protein